MKCRHPETAPIGTVVRETETATYRRLVCLKCGKALDGVVKLPKPVTS